MSPDFDKRLCSEFPNLYIDRHASVRVSCMAWGFGCRDGWYDLIYKLSEKLEKAITRVPKLRRADYRASQVKEKFGTLRFYMSCETPSMTKAIQAAEKESETACERCGQQGKLRRRGGWYSTECNSCYRKVNKENKEHYAKQAATKV